MPEITLRAARRARPLSAETTALAADLSLPYYGQLERGARPLTPQVAERLARVLGVPAESLLAGHERLRRDMRAAVLMDGSPCAL